jgi:hypothetical protein
VRAQKGFSICCIHDLIWCPQPGYRSGTQTPYRNRGKWPGTAAA